MYLWGMYLQVQNALTASLMASASRGAPQYAAPNNSLDASGTSGFVIDNLTVSWLTAAASTQPLGRFKYHEGLRHAAGENPMICYRCNKENAAKAEDGKVWCSWCSNWAITPSEHQPLTEKGCPACKVGELKEDLGFAKAG